MVFLANEFNSPLTKCGVHGFQSIQRCSEFAYKPSSIPLLINVNCEHMEVPGNIWKPYYALAARALPRLKFEQHPNTFKQQDGMLLNRESL
jgi:hypothetical protein